MTLQHAAEKIGRYWSQQGAGATVRFLASRLLRHRCYVVYEARLEEPLDPMEWLAGEDLLVIGPENVDSAVTPDIRNFLGGDAEENLGGVRKGDRLFLIANRGEFQHCGYILFRTRQTKILGEQGHPPLIASCLTAASARGRGLYRRALNAELRYLRDQGYRRAVIETDPENIASRKGIEAAGFRLCRHISAWIILNCCAVQKSVENLQTAWKVVRI